MVHALQQARALLGRDGLLINVHDLPAPHVIEVQTPQSVTKVGWLVDNEDFERMNASLSALAQVVADGRYTLDDEVDFSFKIYADTPAEMREWLAEWWSSAVVSAAVYARLDELARDAGPAARVVLCLRARMTKLRAA